jgi:predicted GIY-YIG superfamily endonuclease
VSEIRAGLSRRSSVGAKADCNKLMMYVYILENIEDTRQFYIGVTRNLGSRLEEHNSGAVSHTAKYRPWRVKNYIAFDNPKKAYSFEQYLKTGSGRAFTKKHF